MPRHPRGLYRQWSVASGQWSVVSGQWFSKTQPKFSVATLAGSEHRPGRLGFLPAAHCPPATDRRFSESWRLELLGNRIEETSIHRGIERSPQFAMIIIGQGNKTERLQAGAVELAGWLQHFRHAVDRA
jgi:hypothetical protein